MCLTGFQTALISAAFGALFGALSALLLNAFADWYRLERIYGRLGLEPVINFIPFKSSVYLGILRTQTIEGWETKGKLAIQVM